MTSPAANGLDVVHEAYYRRSLSSLRAWCHSQIGGTETPCSGLLRELDEKLEKILVAGPEVPVLPALANRAPAGSVPPARIMATCATYWGVTVADLIGDKRVKRLIAPRHTSMWLCRHMLTLTFPEIGEVHGGRDHSTVMAACNKIEREYPRWANHINRLLVALTARETSNGGSHAASV